MAQAQLRFRQILPAAVLLAVVAVLLPSEPVAADDQIVLSNGTVILGSIVKRTERSVWIDIGPDVIRLSVDDIAEIVAGDAEQEIDSVRESLYHTATNLVELTPREHAKRIGAAVIMVSTPAAGGSGVIINEQGYAITNAHVIQGETAIRCTVWFPQPDGTLKREVIRDVEIVAVNNHLDLALLRIPHPESGTFRFAPLEREESIETGQPVFAIGNPMGLERTLSSGVVSTTQRSFDGLTFIQTDTAVNPGNSGGPLFNMRGEVIGIINMGMLFLEGLNFAIPTRYVKDFIRNREAFAYDQANPNAGHQYHHATPRQQPGVAPQLLD
jgi:serine protease Do